MKIIIKERRKFNYLVALALVIITALSVVVVKLYYLLARV